MVLDASVAVAWVSGKERTPALDAVLALLERGSTAWVPSLWSLEVSNVLTGHVRRSNITVDIRDAFLDQLLQYDIRVDAQTAENAWGPTLHLSDKHKLTTYDASYLELALRKRLPLATLDLELRKASLLEDVPLLGL